MKTDEEFIFISAATAMQTLAKVERAKEQATERRLRYEKSHPDRHGSGHPRAIDKEFICWDGEGPRDTGYSLFGNSKGMEICHPGPLSSKECLDLILETENRYPDAIHIIFGGNYDVSNILCDMSRRKFNSLATSGRTSWEGYRLRHVPDKWFDVRVGKRVARIFDIRSFFTGGLVDVLTEWGIGPWQDAESETVDTGRVSTAESVSIPSLAEMRKMTEPQIVRIFKKLRGEFEWKDIDSIRYYMRLELKYTVEMINLVRKTLYDAGYLPSSWHGPGALATAAMRKHHVFDAMRETPPEVREASRYAFIGGRFENRMSGWLMGPVWVYDIHSAYPFYCQFLPNLARGSWRQGVGYEPGKFAVYRIKFRDTGVPFGNDNLFNHMTKLYPLPRRAKTGNVFWPPRVEGWYWAPEAELVADDDRATFVESWVFDEEDPTDRPFAWMGEYYERKESAKRRNDRMGWVWKKIINAVYGQLARRTGWDKKHRIAPKSHQLEWAGFITSSCRASVYRAAIAAGDNLISIDTDGICCLASIDNIDCGERLGQWEVKEYTDGVFWQNGVYFLKKGDEWKRGEAKTRGIPKGSYTVDDLIWRLGQEPDGKEDRVLTLQKQQFITYRHALNGRWAQLNTWITLPIDYKFGGSGGKRHHKAEECAVYCAGLPGNMHRLIPRLAALPPTGMSEPHKLPWLTEEEDEEFGPDDLYMLNPKHIDDDERWLIR